MPNIFYEKKINILNIYTIHLNNNDQTSQKKEKIIKFKYKLQIDTVPNNNENKIFLNKKKPFPKYLITNK